METEEDNFEMNESEREIFLGKTRSGRPIKRTRFENEDTEDEDENMKDVVTTKNKKQNNIYCRPIWSSLHFASFRCYFVSYFL